MDSSGRWVAPNWISSLQGLQDLISQVPEKSSLIRPVLRRRLERMTSRTSLPTQTILWFYDFAERGSWNWEVKQHRVSQCKLVDCWHWNNVEGRHISAIKTYVWELLPSLLSCFLNPNCKFTVLPLKRTTREEKYPSVYVVKPCCLQDLGKQELQILWGVLK